MKSFQIHFVMVLTTFILLTPLPFWVDAAGGTFQERCEGSRNVTTTEGNTNQTVIHQDTCNGDQFLKCNTDKVCGCQDPSNQIFGSKDFQMTEQRRSKRSPKGNKGKGMSAGKAVLVGAVAGIGAYQLNKAVDNIGSSSSSSSHSSQSGSGGSSRKKTMALKSCYSRIGTKCAIDPDRTRQIIQTQTITINDTTTTSTKEVTLNYRKEMSECIQDAECKVKSARAVGDDANIGECVCRDGFLHDPKTDTCVKVKRSESEKLKLGISILFLTLTLSFLF